MRRKTKSDINTTQPGLFDDIEQSRPDVHPSIRDFVVKTRRESLASRLPENNGPIDPIAPARRVDQLLFISFGSGSSGNCAYIGTRRAGLLIDAGIDPKKVETAMRQNGLTMECVKGVCLTHDHSDHVRFVYQLVRLRRDVAIYCTPKVLGGILRRHSLSRRISDYHRPVHKEFTYDIAGMKVTPFDVSHDGTDNCGFFIEAGQHTFAIATDLGSITARVDHYMRRARYIMIEANYDAEMLRRGPYSAFLKSRIAADNGHLDNQMTAQFVTSLAENPELRYIFLCHLSRENNQPEIAIQAVRTALEQAGYGPVGDCSQSLETADARLQLMALPRFDPSPLMVFRLPAPDQ